MNVNINLGGPPGPLSHLAKLIAGIIMVGILLFLIFWICIFGSIIFNTHPLTFALYAFLALVVGGLAIDHAKGKRP